MAYLLIVVSICLIVVSVFRLAVLKEIRRLNSEEDAAKEFEAIRTDVKLSKRKD